LGIFVVVQEGSPPVAVQDVTGPGVAVGVHRSMVVAIPSALILELSIVKERSVQTLVPETVLVFPQLLV
jgi:hypothetical protein